MPKFTKEELALLEKYVTDPEGDVFAVKNMDGMAGAAYARYSRAKGGFREVLLNEFLKEGVIDPKHADALIQRILIAFGDDSVGELEGVHMSLENISNLATKEIEDRRIGGSPIEQSSRYVFFDQKDEKGRFRYLRDKKIMASEYAKEYEETMDFMFWKYAELIEPMTDYFKKRKPLESCEYDIRGTGEKQKYGDLKEDEKPAFERTYKFDLKTKTCDTLRCLLPAATLTNMGIFGNGRFFQVLISHLLTKNLNELNELGEKIFKESSKLIPQYVKRARRNEYRTKNDAAMFRLASELLSGGIAPVFGATVSSDGTMVSSSSGFALSSGIAPAETPDVELLPNYTNEKEYMDFLTAQMLYAYSRHPLSQLRAIVARLPENEKMRIIETYYGERKNRRDRPGRALEFGYPLTFDLLGDFGMYRDIQRHRMCTQERQRLSPYLGFNMPYEIVEAGFGEIAAECRDRSTALHEKLVGQFPEEAQYVVLFGFNIRWTMGMNDREAMHLLELRTVAQGHPAYRKLCQNMHRAIKERSPLRAKHMKFVDHNDYYWSRADSEARQRVMEKELEAKLEKEMKT